MTIRKKETNIEKRDSGKYHKGINCNTGYKT